MHLVAKEAFFDELEKIALAPLALDVGLAGAGAGGAGGYFGGRYLGGKAGEKALKERGVHPVEVEDSSRLHQVLRPALQRKGVDVVMGGKTPYSKKERAALEQAILNRVGAPDPAVLKSLGLPVLK